jgi:hypothetical protein
MKKVLVVLLAFTICISSAWAKKVKFSVDMSDEVISALGVHVMGDFQDEAGFLNGDWQPNTALMTPNGDSSIFTIIVDIPAFRKYEYRFLNGDQSYNTEFIPNPSRVGYDFVDNRWIYIDSLANDTTDIGAIVFGGNAPRGFNLMRFLVQMPSGSSIAAEGIHVIGDFQNLDMTRTYMYSFVQDVYEVIAYDTLGDHQYRFVNGEQSSGLESGIDSCFANNLRTLHLTSDSVLSIVCFNACTQECTSTVSIENVDEFVSNIYPNPSSGDFHFNCSQNFYGKMKIWNLQGQLVKQENIIGTQLSQNYSDLDAGQYVIQIQDQFGNVKQIKKWTLER